MTNEDHAVQYTLLPERFEFNSQVRLPLRYHMKILSIQKLPGNKVYHTACSLPVISKIRVVNFMAEKFQIETYFT